MEMSRRGFLHALGIGGIALTLPKPLEILKAVERPPLHAGRLLFPPLADDVTAFEMYNLSISPRRGIPIPAFTEFFNKWFLKVSFIRNGERDDLAHAPVSCVTHDPAKYPNAPMTIPDRILFTPDMRMDCWLRPGDLDLKYPMPEVDMVLNGRILRKGRRPMSYMMFGKFSTVRMDLEKAKQLGIVPTSEPEDDFELERPEEVATVELAQKG